MLAQITSHNTEAQLAREAVHAAGAVILSSNPSAGIILKEGRANFVTEGDKASERAVFEILHKHLPNDPVLSEETESSININQAPRLWIVDPIDGTHNYRFGRQYSAVSLAYVENGVPIIGAVFNPFRHELFYAERGKGAFLNEQRINVGTQTELKQAAVGTDNSYVPQETRQNLELVLRLPITPWVLMKGSAVLAMCDVAVGRMDAYFHTVLKPWDCAAAFLIVTEAGGVFSGVDGRDIDLTSADAVLGNQTLVEQIVTGFSDGARYQMPNHVVTKLP